MDIFEIKQLISGGEDSFTEFKHDISQRSDFAGGMIAFENSDGGKILVNVEDDGNIVGISQLKRMEESNTNIARNNCVPSLNPIIEK